MSWGFEQSAPGTSGNVNRRQDLRNAVCPNRRSQPGYQACANSASVGSAESDSAGRASTSTASASSISRDTAPGRRCQLREGELVQASYFGRMPDLRRLHETCICRNRCCAPPRCDDLIRAANYMTTIGENMPERIRTIGRGNAATTIELFQLIICIPSHQNCTQRNTIFFVFVAFFLLARGNIA